MSEWQSLTDEEIYTAIPWSECNMQSEVHTTVRTLEKLLREKNAKSADSEPVMDDAMIEFLEGMSVSVDVRTGEHDAEHRYFGTVTEVMYDPEDKHGVTLLVQDAEPNFIKPADSEPVAWRTRRNGVWSYHANEPHGIPSTPLYTTPQPTPPHLAALWEARDVIVNGIHPDDARAYKAIQSINTILGDKP